MIHPPTLGFLADLALLGPSLRVREVNWQEGLCDGEPVIVWPIKGRPFQAAPALLPNRARWAVFEVNSVTGRQELVFDAVAPDGRALPLDRRTLEGLALRKWWAEQRNLAALRRETEARETAARKSETKLGLERDGTFPEAMERLYRDEHGIVTAALGAPGAPAAGRLGGGKSGVEFEDHAPPPRAPEPPADIRVAYE